MTVETRRNAKITLDPAKTYGLCAGRHDMPVCGYIFEHVEDVFNFSMLEDVCFSFIEKHCDGEELHVAVTGLTPCTAALMYTCAKSKMPLILWHFDRNTEEYVPQCFDF